VCFVVRHALVANRTVLGPGCLNYFAIRTEFLSRDKGHEGLEIKVFFLLDKAGIGSGSEPERHEKLKADHSCREHEVINI